MQDLKVHTSVAQARALDARRRADQAATNVDALAARVAELENPLRRPNRNPHPPTW